MRKLLFLFLLVAPACFSQCTNTSGNNYTCLAGSTSAQVQAVLNTATDGFTVTISAGTYTATATSGGVAWAFSNSRGGTIICATAPTLANGAVQDPTPITTMGFNNKLVGAASINPCVIKLGASLAGGAIGTTTASGTNAHFYRISGMTIDCNSFTTPGTGGLIIFSASNGSSATMNGASPNFYGGVRIDHNTFQNCPAATQNIMIGDTTINTFSITGVVDHNYWTGASFETIVEWAGGRPPSYSGSGIGTMNNLFFEDNFFNFGSLTNQSSEGCSDGQWGDTHIVFRFNHSLDCTYAYHAPIPSVMMYWNLVELDANATAQSPINCTRCIHHQGTGEFIAFSNLFKIPSGNPEAGDPIVNQDYRQHAGVGGWTKPTSYTVSGGFTNIVVPTGMFGGACTGNTGGFSRFCFWTTRGFTNAANNAPFNPYDFSANRTTPTSGFSASVGAQVSETVTNGIIGADDNAEAYACDGSISSAPVGFGADVHTTITDGNRSPSATYFGYPCAMQPGRTMPALGTAGTYSPNVFVGNIWTNTGDAAHGLAENPPPAGGTSTVPNAYPPTNCGTATTLTNVCDYFAIHIQANREYFVNFGTAQTTTSSPWDGTFTQHAGYGAGYGTLANRPATCVQSSENSFGGNAGGMYLATDQGPIGADGVTPIGKLYTCSNTGAWIVFFDSATQQYPHPLVSATTQPTVTYSVSSVPITSYAFGPILFPSTSTSPVVTLTNTGNANLVVTNLATTSGLYALVNNACGTSFTLVPTQACTFQVTYTPTGIGTLNAAAVNCTDNTPTSPDALNLSGQGMNLGTAPQMFAGMW